jgi:transposase
MIKKSRFLRFRGMKKELNDELIKQAKLKAGIKGHATNLSGSAEMIIGAYHNLLEVEKSFRMVKSDLKARPIFHQKRDSIEAHLTICFGALAISMYIQEKTKISIKKFVQRLEPLKTAVIKMGSKEITIKPEIDEETLNLINLL